MKPGFKTTEFWLSIATMIFAIVVVLQPTDAGEKRLAVGSVPFVVGIYTHGRARVKSAGALGLLSDVAKFLNRN